MCLKLNEILLNLESVDFFFDECMPISNAECISFCMAGM
jgi:hypothetical protein